MKSHIISIACYCFGFHTHWIIHVLHWSIRDGFRCNLYSWNMNVFCTFLLMDRSKNGEQLWHWKQQTIHSEISMPNSYYNFIILERFLTVPVHWIHNVIQSTNAKYGNLKLSSMRTLHLSLSHYLILTIRFSFRKLLRMREHGSHHSVPYKLLENRPHYPLLINLSISRLSIMNVIITNTTKKCLWVSCMLGW